MEQDQAGRRLRTVYSMVGLDPSLPVEQMLTWRQERLFTSWWLLWLPASSDCSVLAQNISLGCYLVHSLIIPVSDLAHPSYSTDVQAVMLICLRCSKKNPSKTTSYVATSFSNVSNLASELHSSSDKFMSVTESTSANAAWFIHPLHFFILTFSLRPGLLLVRWTDLKKLLFWLQSSQICL